MTMFEHETQSYYQILDVKPDATQNEIRQAYFRAKAAYSKDSAALYSLFDEHETRQVLDNIEQAYLVLSNPEKRKEYDKVHGFLKSNDLLPTGRTTKSPSGGNIFSFGTGANSKEITDPAREAAHSVFGRESMAEDIGGGSGGSSGGSASHTENSKSATAMRSETHDEYSTPRTLASHNAAGPPTQDYNSPTSGFNSRENRLGIVRRVDLVKPFKRDETLEEEINRETGFRGEFFRKVREYRDISVEELSEFTKISRTYINCIESEEFEGLPAPAYLRGFVVQIARALKLPHDKAAAGYMSNYKNAVK